MTLLSTFQPLTYRTVGFDRLFDNMQTLLDKSASQIDKFPPHNIIRTNENQYIVELAIAGFKQEDIDITLEKGVMTISGTSKVSTDENVEYLYKGIGTRSFTKTLRIADTVIVRGAEMRDGVLRIGLENVIPENEKARKIEIGKSISFDKPTLLTE